MEENGWIGDEHGLRAGVLAGDDRAWHTLYTRHFAALYAYVHWRAGRDPHRSEEIVQECWLVAVRRIRRFDPGQAGFQTWLRGIAENVLRNHRRRWWRRGRIELAGPPAESAEATCAPGDAVEQAELVCVALTALPQRYEAVLRAKYEQGASVAEIAHRSGDTPKAVESLLARARAAFRAEYAQLVAMGKGVQRQA